jgi:hypothetical protein
LEANDDPYRHHFRRCGDWIQTVPNKSWFIRFRLYGPLGPWFDKAWRPGDIEAMA